MWISLVAVLLVSALIILESFSALIASLYGGAITLAGTALLLWYEAKASRLDADEKLSLRLLNRCAVERLFLTAALFALGLGPIGLEPLPLLVGFVAGQIPLFMGAREKK